MPKKQPQPLTVHATRVKDAGLADEAKAFQRAITALQVIHTWATFEGGFAMHPKEVAELTRKTLGV
jgi:hypothetical protein